MGLYKDKESIIKSAINKISSISSYSVSDFASPEQAAYLNTFNEIVAEETERFLYPFSVIYVKLTNPFENIELTDDEKVGFIAPEHSRILGVYKESSLPDLSFFIHNITTLISGSLEYSSIGDNIVVSKSDIDDESLYVIITVSNPPVSYMSTSFQRYLVFQLAYENFYKTGSNSRFLAQLKREAKFKRSIAENLVLTSNKNYTRRVATLREVLEFGRIDGSV